MPNEAPSFTIGTGTGVVTADFGGTEGGYHITEMADGRIIVTGRYGGSNNVMVLRYNADGTPDTTFGGGDGIATLVQPAGVDFSLHTFQNPAVVDASGNIWVAGFTTGGPAADRETALIKYGPDGVIDATFGGGDGYVTTDLTGTHDIGYSLTIDANGKILVSGSTYNGSTYDFSVTRYNADGTLDTTFGVNGSSVIANPGIEFGQAITVLPNGNILIEHASDTYFTRLTMLDSNGALDSSFGSGSGTVTIYRAGVGDLRATSLIDQNGNIVVGGDSSLGGSARDFFIARYSPDGVLDISFDTDGIALDGGTDNAYGYAIAEQSDGKLVVVGYSVDGSNNTKLVRFNSDGSLDTGFGSNGVVIEELSTGTDIAYGVEITANGKILVTGYLSNGSDSDFFLAQYNSDGTLDTRFGVPDTLGDTVAYTEGDPAVTLDADVAITDAEMSALNGGDGDFGGASVTLARTGGADGDDVFSFGFAGGSTLALSGGDITSGGAVIATVANSGGTLTISFTNANATPTTALVNEIMRAIQYANSSDTPPASVEITWSFSDGTDATTGTSTVTITDVPEAPLVTITEDANDDGFINAAESSGAVDVSIDISATGAVAGDTLTYDDGGTPANYTLTAGDITAGAVAVTVPAPADGATLTVTASITSGGNTGPSGSDSAVYDATPPPAPGVALANDTGAPGDNITNDPSLTVTGVETGAQVQYSLDSGASWVDADPSATPPAFGADGAKSIIVRQTDSAGNTGPSTTLNFELDTVMPTISIDSYSAGSIVNAAEETAGFTISGTSTDADGLTATIVVDGKSYSPVIQPGGAWSITVNDGDLTSGDGTINVTAEVDDGSNPVAQDSSSFVLDTTAPVIAIDAIDDDVNALSEISGTTDDTADVVVTITVDSVDYTATVTPTGGNWTASIGAFSPSLTLTDGKAYTVSAVSTDTAGNESTAAAESFDYDTTTPAITIDDIADRVNSVTEITGTSDDDATDVDVTITVGGTDYSASVTPSGGSWSIPIGSFTGLSLTNNGEYTVTATSTDAAGNTGTATPDTFIYDTHPPSITIDTIEGDDIVNAIEAGDDIQIGGTTSGANSQTVTITVAGASGSPYTTTASGNTWSFDIPSADLSDATGISVSVSVSDEAGNGPVTANSSFDLDRSAPAITLDDIADRVSALSEIAGTSDDDATNVDVTITVDGTDYTASATPSGGAWSIAIGSFMNGGTPLALEDGKSYAVSAVSADAAGNANTALSDSFAYDTDLPGVASVSFGDPLINDADDAGTGTLSITFDEAMDTGVAPSVSITANADITVGAGSWNGNTVYEIAYTVTDTEKEVADVEVSVSGAQDLAGNTMDAVVNMGSGTEVDTLNPAALSPDAVTIDEIADQDAGAAAPVTLATFSNADALPSGDALTYSLPSTTGKYAHVQLTDDGSGNTLLQIKGDATARAWFDFEERSAADLTFDITATDDAGNTTTTPFAVTLTDANDAPELGAGPNTFGDTLNERTDGVAGENDAPFGIGGTFTVHDDDIADTFAIQIQNVSASRDIGGTVSSGQPFLGFFEAGFDDPITGDGDGVVGWDFRIDSGIQGAAAAANMAFIDSLAAGDSVTQVYRVLVQETNGGGEVLEQDVTVTIEGTNDKPVIGAIASPTLGEDSASATISVSYDDVDLSDTDQVATISAASVGSGTDNAQTPLDGATLANLVSIAGAAKAAGTTSHSFDMDFDATSGVFDYLAAGESVTIDYTLKIANSGDDVTKDFSVTVTGSNDGPVIDSITPTGALTEQTDTSDLTATATVNFTDLDLSDVDQAVSVTAATVCSGTDSGFDEATLLGLVTPDNAGRSVSTSAATGSIDIDFVAASGVFDYLADGDTVTLRYTVEVSDGDATSASETFDITITGTNDAPVIDAIVQTDLTEQADTDPLTATVNVTFDDVDLSDVGHSASVALDSKSGDTSGLGLSDAQLADLFTSITTSKVAGDGDGSVTLGFSAAATAFDYLAKDEVLTLNYLLTVDDGDSTATKPFVVEITGTNDAPVIDAIAQTDLTEQTDSDPLTATVNVTFDDVDLSDVGHSASVALVSTGGDDAGLALDANALTSLFTSITTSKVAGDGDGSVRLGFSAAATAFDYLAKDEVLTLNYLLTVDDGDSTATKPFVVQITGTNDAPTIDASGELDSASGTAEEGDGVLALAGTLSIADVDVTDTVATGIHAVSATGTAGNGFDLTDSNGNLEALFGVTGALSGAETEGSADWAFNAAAGDFDYLAHDEQITITYTVRVTDSEGATADQDVTITVTGTNDRPEISEGLGDSATAGITESLPADMTGTDLVANGTLTLTDDDASDTHTVSIARGATTWAQTDDSSVGPNTDIPAATLTALDGALTQAINAGKIEWAFTLDDGLADFLAEGEKLTVEYTLTADDGNGFDGSGADEDSDSAPQTVTITITGSDDAPVVTATSPAAFTEGNSVLVDGDNTKTGDAAADTVTVHLFEQGTTAGNDVYVTEITEKDLNDTVTIANISVALDVGTTSRAAAHAVAYDAAAVEAAFSVDSAGTVSFDRNAAIFDSLDDGENVAVTVSYDIVSTTPAGTITTENRSVTLQVNGENDQPYIISDAGFANDVTEITDAGPEDEATYEHVIPGSITFNDVDITDTHTVTITATGGTTPLADYVGSLSGGNIPIDRVTPADGTVYYTYRVHNSVIENLTEGESFTQNYTVQISDGTQSFSRDIEITITGTNDAPVISAGPTAAQGADTEEANTTDGSATLSAIGAIVFTDADTSSLAAATQDADTFTVTSAFKSAVHKDSGGTEISTDTTTAVGAVTNDPITNNTGTDDGSGSHMFMWGFTVADKDVDFLAEGETLEVSYDFTIKDDSGTATDSVVQTVTVTLTGANDVPTISSATTADPVTEAGGVNDTDAGTPEVTGDLSAGGNWVDVDNGEQAQLVITEGSANGDPQAALTFDGTVTGANPGEAAIAGTYGTLFIQNDGQYRYVLDNDATATKELDGGDTVFETFDYTIANNGGGAGNEATSTLTVNITGANDAPVISVGSGDSAAGAVEEEGVDASNAPVNVGPTTATGTLTKTDDDADDTAANDTWTVVAQGGDQAQTSAMLVTGKYGALSVDADGTWTFTLDNADADVQALHDSESVTETFTVQVDDGNGGTDTQDIVITINGTNDAPVITANAGADTDVTESGEDASGVVAGDTEASGSFTMSDVDTGGSETGVWTIQSQNSTQDVQTAASGAPATLDGAYGTLTLNDDGTWSYALDQADADTQALNDGDSATDDFVLRYDDGLGGYDEATVSIDVTGTNDAPTITNASTVSGVVEAGGVADADAGTDEVSGDLSAGSNWGDVDDGEAANLAVTKGAYDGDAQGALSFDGSAPDAMAGEAAIAGTYGTLFIQDDGQYRYVLDNSATATKELDGGESVSEIFDYTIANNGGGVGNEATSSLTVNITGANDAPVISVGTGDSDVGTVEEQGVNASNDPVNDGAGDNAATGTLSRSDDDAGDTAVNDTWTVVAQGGDQAQTSDGGTGTLANSVDGKYGTLSVDADGAWTFTLDNADPDVQALHDSESVTETFTVQLADGNGGTDTHDVTVTINGTNDAPQIAVDTGAIPDNEVTEAGEDGSGVIPGDANASGAFTASDVDTGGADGANWSIVNGTVTTAASGAPAVVTGTYGSLTLNDDGTWSYMLDDNAAATQALDGGDSETDDFTVRVDDGLGGYTESTVSITVNGTNDGPVAVDDLTTYVAPGDAGNVQVTDEDTAITVDVLANDTDPDADDGPANFTLDSVTFTGVSGAISSLGTETTATTAAVVGNQLVFTPGSAFDALDLNDTAVVTIDYTMSDADGVESSATATITVVGTNDAPELGDVTTAPAVVDTAADDAFADVTGAVAATDADAGATLTYTIDGETVAGGETSLAGQYGTLTLDAATGGYSYVVDPAKLQALNAGDVPNETFTLRVTDEHGASDTAELTVDITPANDAPELADVDAGDVTDTNAADVLADITGNLVAEDRDAGEGDDGTGASTGITYVIDGETPVDGATTQTFTYERAASGVAAATITLGTLTVLEDGSYTFAPDDDGINALRGGETPVISTTIRATDGGGLDDTATLSIDVTGANDDPVILNPGVINVEAKEQAEANEGDLIQVGGTIEYDDAELDDAHSFGFTAQGTGYAGSITFTPGDATGPGTGTLGWSFEIADSVVNSLAEGEALGTSPQTYTITISDGNGGSVTQDVVIDIVGTNDAPVITGAVGEDQGAVTEAVADAAVTTKGTLNVTDEDTSDTVTISVTDASVTGGTYAGTQPLTMAQLQAMMELAPGADATSGFGATAAGLDADTGAGSDFTWQFTSGSAGNAAFDFLGDGETLEIAYELTATDSTSAATKGTDTQTVTITVTGTNDAPVAAADLIVSADEDAGEADVLATASATDVDMTDTLTYAITGGDPSGLFEIDGSTGEISLAGGQSLDAETAQQHVLTVTASDGTLSDTQQVTIDVNDVDDNPTTAPVDTDAAANEVAENATSGTVGITAHSTDGDVTADAPTYAIVGGTGMGVFVIDANTGVVSVDSGAAIDRETTASYTLDVQASTTMPDGGSSSTVTTFTIDVTDVDEFDVTTPVDADTDANEISETAAAGTAVGITASASDADATTNGITYSLTDDAGGRFVIDATSGVVSLAAAGNTPGGVDYETDTSHTIIVQAKSEDGSTATETFTIQVLNENDNAPVMTSDVNPDVDENTTSVVTLTANDPDGNSSAVTFSITGGSDAALFDIVGGELVFKVAPDFEAPADTGGTAGDNIYEVEVTSTDEASNATTQMVTVTVNDVNEAPTAVSLDNGVTTIAENTGLSSSLKVADIVIDDDALGTNAITLSGADAARFEIVDNGGNMELHFRAGASPDFEAPDDADADGSYDVTVTVEDASVTGSTPVTAGFTLAVTDVNEAPVAFDVAAGAFAEDAFFSGVIGGDLPIAGFATDIDGGLDAGSFTFNTVSFDGALLTGGDPLGDAGVSYNSATGLFSFDTSTALYQPLNPGDSVDVVIGFTVDDGEFTDDGTITFTVEGVNDLPVVEAGSDIAPSGDEDTAITGAITATDVDSDASITYSVASGDEPASGGVTIDANTGAYTYTPNAEFNGADSFTVTIEDGQGGSVTQVVNVTVNPVDDAPVAADDVATTDEDTGKVIDVASLITEVDGDSVTITASVDPAEGSVSVSGTEITFTPAANFNGDATITYTVTDDTGAALNDSGDLTVTVNPVDDAPVAADDVATTDEDTATPIDVASLITEVDGDSVTVTASVDPAEGSVSVSGTIITFTPAANFNGDATITYTVTDDTGAALNDSGDITVTVNPVNDPTEIDPSAQVNATHVEAVDAAPVVPTAVAANVVIEDVDGLDYDTGAFTASVTGGDATDQLTLAGTAADGDVTIGGTVVGTVSGTGTGTLAVTFNADADAAAVQAVIQSLSYATTSDTPAASRTITLDLSDGDGADAAQQSVTVDITAMNDSPIANDDAITVAEGAFSNVHNVLTIGTPDSDPEGDTLSVTQLADIDDVLPVGGTLESASVPGSGAGVITTDWGAEVTLQANGLLSYNLTSGSAKFNELAAGETAIDRFSYTVSDGNGGTDTATVAVTITGVNDQIQAKPDTIDATEGDGGAVTAHTLNGGAVGSLLDNDMDVDVMDTREIIGVGNSVTATAVATAGGFQITLASGAVIDLATDGSYTITAPDSMPEGVQTATFSYTVQDGGSAQSTTTVTVNITGTNDAPVATVVTLDAIDEDTSAIIDESDLLAGVSDVDGPSLAITDLQLAAGSAGTLVDNGDGTWTYTPAANDDGSVTFDYTASDGTLTATSTAELDLLPVNDPAVIGGDVSGGVTEDDATDTVTGTLTITDVDTGEAAFAPQTGTAGVYGSFDVDAAGAWSYTLDNGNAAVQALPAGDTLTDTITVASVDGTTQDVTITITGTNDAAVIAGDVTGDATEDDSGAVTGALTITDVDTGEAAFTPQTGTAGAYGSFDVDAAGAWSYTLDNGNPAVQALPAGDTLTDTITVASVDGTTQDVTITITGANDAAVIAGDVTGDATEDDSGAVTGALTITDVDTGEAAFTPQTGTAGAYGSFDVDAAGAWSYTLDNGNAAVQALPDGDTLTDTITVASVDGTTQDVTITITGANDAAVIAGDISGTVSEDQAGGVSQTAGTLNVTDVDTGEASFVATTGPAASANGYGVFEVNAVGEWTFTVDASDPVILGLNDGDSLTDSFEVSSVDGATQTVSVTIDGANNLFVGDAGDNALTGGPGMDTLSGLGGDDTLMGSAGDDTMLGGDGDDRLVYVDGFDVWDGGAGTDWGDFSSFASAVWIDLQTLGSEGWTRDNDDFSAPGAWRQIAAISNIENFIGTDGVDYFIGNDEDNVYAYRGVMAKAGIEVIDGAGGNDTVDFSDFASSVWIDLQLVQNVWTRDTIDQSDMSTGAWRGIATVTNVETYVGTDGIDYFAGDAGDNTFGYVGNASIDGVEEMIGRGGSDTADFSRFDSSIWVDLRLTDNTVWTRDNDDQNDVAPWRVIADMDGMENVVGTEGIDYVSGNEEDNSFFYEGTSAITGQDQFLGRGGVDTIDFSRFESAVWVDLGRADTAWTLDTASHSDTGLPWRRIADASDVENLTGTDFNDYLEGDGYDNVITGGAGDDDLIGGGGADTFVFATGSGSDVIHDFEDGSDLLDVSGWGQSFAELTITDDGTDSTVSNGVDEVTLLDMVGLTEDDFIF